MRVLYDLLPKKNKKIKMHILLLKLKSIYSNKRNILSRYCKRNRVNVKKVNSISFYNTGNEKF